MQASEPMTGMSDAALIEVLDPFAQQNGVCVEVSWANGEVLHQCILGEVHGLETRGLVSPMSFVSRAKADITYPLQNQGNSGSLRSQDRIVFPWCVVIISVAVRYNKFSWKEEAII